MCRRAIWRGECASSLNRFFPDRKLARIVVPWDQFPVYLDVLRNEKPIYAYLNSDRPISNRIYTGEEPIGVDED